MNVLGHTKIQVQSFVMAHVHFIGDGASMVTRLQAGQVVVWIPVGQRIHLQNIHTGSGAHPLTCSRGKGGGSCCMGKVARAWGSSILFAPSVLNAAVRNKDVLSVPCDVAHRLYEVIHFKMSYHFMLHKFHFIFDHTKSAAFHGPVLWK